MYDAIIIGAGVVGSAVARELSRFKGSFALMEKTEDVCSGTSKANSAIIHAGFDAKNGSLMAKLNVRGNFLMDEISRDLDVPFKRCGALVLCFDNDQIDKLYALRERGIENGVLGLKVLTREEAIKIEPELSDKVCAALFAPTSGIVCPFQLTIGYAENAAENGVEFFFEAPVTNIEKLDNSYKVTTAKGIFESRAIINCAGVYADEIHNLICEDKLKIVPRRGEYLLCDKSVGSLVSHTLFQLPTALGKGILVSPTVDGNLILGPTAEDLTDKEDISTTQNGLATVVNRASLSVKNLPTHSVITSFSGLRAHTEGDEFVIKEGREYFFDALGIESPGLSSAPAIGEYIAEMVGTRLTLTKKSDFKSIRRAVIKADHLPFDERVKLIENEPKYGHIICRCEMISEGEILSAIHRPLGARTLDGIKRRTRAGAGRCQSGFCSPRVMDILARELNIPIDKIKKNMDDSFICSKKSTKGVQ